MPWHNPTSMPSALSRFLNHGNRPTWRLAELLREFSFKTFTEFAAVQRERKPTLLLILDFTSFEKEGSFPELGRWLQVFSRNPGVHLVVLLLVYGSLCLLVGFIFWRERACPHWRSSDSAFLTVSTPTVLWCRPIPPSPRWSSLRGSSHGVECCRRHEEELGLAFQ